MNVTAPRIADETFAVNPFAALGRNTTDRPAGELRFSGAVPEALDGALFRNGPGLFRRGGLTKRTLIDGDGAMQRLELSGGRARYARRFVRTPKFIAESAANRFLSPTWTTKAPGFLTNVGQHFQSQAGVTTYVVNDTLLALDEGAAPGFEIDTSTLETIGPAKLGLPDRDAAPKAHAKHIASNGDWLFCSTRFGAKGMTIDFVRHGADGSRVNTPTVTAPRMAYVHDYGANDRYAVVILQAVDVRGVRFLTGQASFAECLEWHPAQGNLVLLVDLASGETQTFEARASWVWHFANVYERGTDVVADFVGYDDPGHFLGKNAQLAAVMLGRQGVHGAPGLVRRFVLGRTTGKLVETVLADGNYEFPSVDPRAMGATHERVYATCGSGSGMLHSGIAALDTRTGRVDSFDFGAHVNAGEPIFAADPTGACDVGWLITQTLDARAGTSNFEILDARRVADGPIATIELGEIVPISLHGQWVAN